MLTGVRVYSSDGAWRQILTDLNAAVVDAPDMADVNFDLIAPDCPISSMELKSILLNAMDETHIVERVLGARQTLPSIQARIVARLYKSGGMTASQLKVALGYSPDAATHAVDTAIYSLRRTFGRDFIQNNNGVYSLGRI